ncbi:hypothetical protein G6O67_005488 [Ophiocordyceps sinensis]|uniref:Uncharacterized protein n=1 Tax=Ophiocordyceps sinensis TaxID=72228 RepID=A0A8H4PRN8_9HYPO|nr:hypothetical protein G6O67_005488 [Ophiocordyceps sinensis]
MSAQSKKPADASGNTEANGGGPTYSIDRYTKDAADPWRPPVTSTIRGSKSGRRKASDAAHESVAATKGSTDK